MSTRSLIGAVVDAEGTYHARYCHNDGSPAHQLPQLADALHRYHGGSPELLADAILTHEWSALAADEATAELTSGDRPPLRPDHIQPYAGIGYYYTDVDAGEPPIIGTLGEETNPAYEWLYVFSGDLLRVFANNRRERRWQAHRDYPVYDLKDLDLTEVQAKVRG